MKTPHSILSLFTLALMLIVILGMGIVSDKNKIKGNKVECQQKKAVCEPITDYNYHIQLGSLPY